ncbi:MAG: ATP-binding cassette domain-containing protein [Isosphaeraceae bacterium]
MTTHLAAVGLEKGYRKGKSVVPVLRGMDVEADHGEFVAVVGASGSGKSTLLHVLGLLDAPDSGRVILEGQRIDNLPDRHRDRLRNGTFGFIFQFYHLLPELTALENVMMPQLIRHGVLSYFSARKRLQKEATALLERVGLSHRLTHYPSELSGGEDAAPRSPGPWPAGRACCSPTSRRGTSTRPPARPSWNSCAT